MRWGRVWSTGCWRANGPPRRAIPRGPPEAPRGPVPAAPAPYYRRTVDERSLDRLRRFLETAPAARRAMGPLAPGARVALRLDEGPAGFTLADGAPRLAEGPLDDPDFTLTLPAAAVARLEAEGREEVAEAGLSLFRLVLERDPSLRVGVSVQAPLPRLVRHGWLAVVALGGARVALWLVKRGLANPAAVIERLRRPGAGR